jgi:hypothetical protein
LSIGILEHRPPGPGGATYSLRAPVVRATPSECITFKLSQNGFIPNDLQNANLFFFYRF